MFDRYQQSHGKQHLPCPTSAEIEKSFAELKKLGLTDFDAYHLMALRGGGAMAVQNSNGGGRYPAFLQLLRAKGFKVSY
jgi:hypothetical protein